MFQESLMRISNYKLYCFQQINVFFFAAAIAENDKSSLNMTRDRTAGKEEVASSPQPP